MTDSSSEPERESAALEPERAAVADACRRLGAEGLLIGTAGNVSVRVEDRVAITATGAVLAELTADQVTLVDLDGKVVGGNLQPTSELDLHLGVYRRYGSGAIVHTHAPMATALSLVLDELPCIHYQLLALGGTVRVAPYATFGTPDLAESVLEALEGRSAAIMANHGAVTHAPTLDKAVEHALLLEWACGVYQHAAALGRPRALDEQQQLAVIEAAIARNYGTTHPIPPAQEGNR
ncbi:class II aldolase/adducin family protein [Streptomyces sp. NPDC047081]|uniref:class II aldolase/adducin family protein n=1 Tax=Streptomyces sp. NPDC047081 TaxID=3154706 RepID=UPI0033ECDFF0